MNRTDRGKKERRRSTLHACREGWSQRYRYCVTTTTGGDVGERADGSVGRYPQNCMSSSTLQACQQHMVTIPSWRFTIPSPPVRGMRPNPTRSHLYLSVIPYRTMSIKECQGSIRLEAASMRFSDRRKCMAIFCNRIGFRENPLSEPHMDRIVNFLFNVDEYRYTCT